MLRAHARTLVARSIRLRQKSEAMRAKASEIVAQANELCDKLKAAVSQYTRAMHYLGEPPERVIAVVKDTVDEGARDAFAARLADPMAVRALRDEVVRWAIDSYYGSPL